LFELLNTENQPNNNCGVCLSGLLPGVGWEFGTDVKGQPIRPILRVEQCKENTRFSRNVASQSRRTI